MNLLSKEKSPYLKQHESNPVDWHPWNDATLKKAKELNLPIFLSIGYSTCHWCHVMAHESFENEKIAAVMNKYFLNIKVDREERPDVDAIYMTAVQALTGSGGWPMSVWLTPELKPFYAGTYFPPEDRYGRVGFPAVLKQLAEMWEKDQSQIIESADQVTDMLKQYMVPNSKPVLEPLNVKEIFDATFLSIKSQFDQVNGGFGPAPKFPMPVYMEFLLEYFHRTNTPEALSMVEITMKKISQGGIYDHLGGGFARYSTDNQWIVPHFEKMLYDNAQLISVAAGLAATTGKDEWKTLTRHAISYVLRDLTHSGGAFFSAEDADSEGKEGTFYVWTVHEVRESLSPEEAEAFLAFYGLSVHGNFTDPHHPDETGKNILVKTGTKVDGSLLASAEKKMMVIRNFRPRPHRDEKILTEWNGLMISALAKASSALKEPAYLESATKAANFIQKHLYSVDNQALFRSWCDGTATIPAQQIDYAMLIQGLLDLWEVSANKQWLDWAVDLHLVQDKQFFDEELGGYFMNVSRPDLLIRMKDDTDNVIPSGNSVAVRNGHRLAKAAGRPELSANAQKTTAAFSVRLKNRPLSMANLVMGLPSESGQL